MSNFEAAARVVGRPRLILLCFASSCSQIYQNLDYSVADLEAAAGGHIAISDDKSTVIMARMRNPSLSIHGIEGAFSGVGAKTVIPATVGGKFSLRSVHTVCFSM